MNINGTNLSVITTKGIYCIKDINFNKTTY